jgi:hypothetical protein
MLAGQQDLAAAVGVEHPLTLLFALNAVAAMDALGQSPGAEALLNRAEPVLRRALGETAPTYSRVQRLQARIHGAAASARSLTLDFFS